MGFITPADGYEAGDDPRPIICANCGTSGIRRNRFCGECGVAYERPGRELQPPPVARQPEVIQPAPYPQHPYAQQQPYLPPPPQNITQRVTVVQHGPEPIEISGCAWFAIFLIFPLWPLTIPAAIVISIINSGRRRERRNVRMYVD